MSTSHLRIVAAGLSLIVAVLAGVLAGFVGPRDVCWSDRPQSAPTSATPTAPVGGPDSNTGTGQAQGGDTGPPEESTPGTSLVRRCGRSFSVSAALVGFGGALLTGIVVGGIALVAPRRETAPAHARPVRAASPAGPPPVGPPPVGPPPATAPVGNQVIPVPVSAAPAAAGSDEGQARQDRSTLVQTCIYVRDRVTSKAIADRLGWALQEVGVVELVPTGATFDPAHHEAGGATQTDEPHRVGTVAAVETPGYADRGAVLRPPVVTVYRGAGQ